MIYLTMCFLILYSLNHGFKKKNRKIGNKFTLKIIAKKIVIKIVRLILKIAMKFIFQVKLKIFLVLIIQESKTEMPIQKIKKRLALILLL
jgi:hypothetical protein